MNFTASFIHKVKVVGGGLQPFRAPLDCPVGSWLGEGFKQTFNERVITSPRLNGAAPKTTNTNGRGIGYDEPFA
jgi:hypothetical protein